MPTKPKTVDEYIKKSPKEAREKLNEIRGILKSVAPRAKEDIKWGYPVLEEARILFSFSAFRDHLNFMPTRSTLDNFRKELKNYKTGRDTIQFPYTQPLPKRLVRKIAAYRVKEVQEGSLWMHNSSEKKKGQKSL